MNEKNDDRVSRRSLFKIGAGLASGLAASSSLANICGPDTGRQPLGPFFPNEGTAKDPIREIDHPGTPIHLANDNDLTFVKGRSARAQGQTVYIRGIVKDKNCAPIPNAIIVIWQASSTGLYNHSGDSDNQDFRHPLTGQILKRKLDPHFQYWGKVKTDKFGRYKFKTVVPGFYPANLSAKWYRPPHIHFMVTATGHPQLVTQMYFRGKDLHDHSFIEKLNGLDPLLQDQSLTEEQRQNLIVHFARSPHKNWQDGPVGRFDLSL